MFTWSPIATTTWLLSLMFLLALMMRLGVNYRFLLTLEIPERIRELRLLSSFSFMSRRTAGLVVSLLPPIMLVILSFCVRTFFSTYLSVPVILCGLFWVQLLMAGLWFKGERSMEMMVSRGCEASSGSNPPCTNSLFLLYSEIACLYRLTEGTRLHYDFSVS